MADSIPEVDIHALVSGGRRLQEERAEITMVLKFLGPSIWGIIGDDPRGKERSIQKIIREMKVFHITDTLGYSIYLDGCRSHQTGEMEPKLQLVHGQDDVYEIIWGQRLFVESLPAEVVGVCHAFLKPLVEAILRRRPGMRDRIEVFYAAAERAK